MTTTTESPDYHISGDIVLPDDNKRPIFEYIILGFQHVVAMFGSTVLAPILMGFDPNVTVLFSGVATLLFYIAVGGKVPSYLGSSFSFIAAVGVATDYSFHGPNPNIPIALGGIMAAGLLYFIVGLIVSLSAPPSSSVCFPEFSRARSSP